MKKAIINVLIIAGFVLAVYFLYELCLPTRVFFWNNHCSVVLNGNSTAVSGEDSKRLKNLFTGYWCYYDNPSCGGFSDAACIDFGLSKFYLGYDTCGTIRTGNKYFTLSEDDAEEYFSIMKKYGVSFPMY